MPAAPPWNWDDVRPADEAGAPAVDPRRRLRWAWLAFLLGCAMVFARLVTLEVNEGPAFRAAATRPIERRSYPPGMRGRIVTRDGTVLAADRPSQVLAIEYRRLQDPPHADWLRRTARAALPRRERRDAARLAEAEAKLRVELIDQHRRLADLCGVSPAEWERRRAAIQTQVERISRRVNERRTERDAHETAQTRRQAEEYSGDEAPWYARLAQIARRVLTPDETARESVPIVVAEELAFHVVSDDLTGDMVDEIERHPERYPGVRIEERMTRDYPVGTLAANLLGHLGVVAPEEIAAAASSPVTHAYDARDRVGRMGLEAGYEPVLRGTRGETVEYTDPLGRVLSVEHARQAAAGHDLVLTVDAALQESAERLLDGMLARRPRELSDPTTSRQGLGGGAIVALDVDTGAVLVAASAPRFDPSLFLGGDPAELQRVLVDAEHPLFDRATRMALAPGSTFEPITALALLNDRHFDAQESFDCQGYYKTPERQRCAQFVRTGEGHGELTLHEALAADCNVYFYHHALALGPPKLIDVALRLRFGRPTGLDLPGESRGFLPTPANIRDIEGHAWRHGDTQTLAVGQGSLAVTPLQMARAMAAIANDGRLVTPYLVERLSKPAGGYVSPDLLSAYQPSRGEERYVETIDRRAFRELRGALHLADRHESAVETEATKEFPAPRLDFAGKAGTAETAGARASHAWFAGFAPADAPCVAFVVVLEHAGDAQQNALPIATRLVERMRQLGYFESDDAPPGARVAGMRRGESLAE
ncbi:MAG: hypothetical protein KF708_01535 [Pirellulales bacterium]|nr:hypothetical protein [Pirellulales bacterium]